MQCFELYHTFQKNFEIYNPYFHPWSKKVTTNKWISKLVCLYIEEMMPAINTANYWRIVWYRWLSKPHAQSVATEKEIEPYILLDFILICRLWQNKPIHSRSRSDFYLRSDTSNGQWVAWKNIFWVM